MLLRAVVKEEGPVHTRTHTASSGCPVHLAGPWFCPSLHETFPPSLQFSFYRTQGQGLLPPLRWQRRISRWRPKNSMHTGRSKTHGYKMVTLALSKKKGLQPFPAQPLNFSMVPELGIEPRRTCVRGILSPLRLPISPLRHCARII
jgi:hypothetical protein